jgi:DNA polymerase-3 subunit gamma/tau
MLRAHSDVSYKAEQRFHLELGLLKMVHAQRLLPIEEVLTGAATQTARDFSVVSSAASRTVSASSKSISTQPGGTVSPFERDRSRKSASSSVVPEAASSFESPSGRASGPLVISGHATAPALAVASAPEIDLREAVLRALEQSNQRVLAATLEGEGEWLFEGDELSIKVARPASFLEMAMSAEARRIATFAASGAAGRSVKIRLESSDKANGNGQLKTGPSNQGGGESARARAANDPIVRRMQEKFNAEIRTVIDHREKKR